MAMRSVGSYVANSRIGQYMKRVCVEEVAEKPGQTFLVLAGAMWYANHKQAEEVRKIIEQYHKEQAKVEMLKRRVHERKELYMAKKDDFMLKMLKMLKMAIEREVK